jgi:type VI secretion system Hcp family effector
VALPSAASALTSAKSTAHDPIYMQIANIPGEVTQNGFLNAIQVDSWQWSITNAHSTSAGVFAAGGRPTLGPITLTMPLSRAIPPLLTAAATGVNIAKTAPVTIDFVNVGGEGPPVSYLHISLDNVYVSSVQESSGGQAPTEAITLNFAQIDYIYRYNGTNITFCWSALTNAATCIPQPG